ncbi:polysaccharide pyruvyl transferase family protein [Aquabacter sp. P-9]|uniref:polysaccharide pyruvyl transferase family protein n=1 Tax=Aquabacter sediminis TaxID=3029197 RepID=UPI00237E80A6|nr:polysaccharide pyruvyl transferase family protein [Aquabacter sp. P-9]MDE1568025.1 polysaccharide pyruvyl transferase family protein [Aquabacter sp. P-9]
MTEGEGAARRVHVCGNFDIFNYGDVLFPLVARHRLAPAGYEVVPVAPTARRSWPDSLPALSLQDLFAGAPGAGILVGGGHIISDMPVTDFFGISDVKDDPGGTWAQTYFSGLWLGATLQACVTGVPIAWNAPGVMRPFIRSEIRALALAAMNVAERVAVRDAESQRLLGPQAEGRACVSPDTVLDISALWPREGLAKDFAGLVSRAGFDPGQRFLAIQVRRLLKMEAFPDIAAQISAHARASGLVPILVAIGPGLRDDEAARHTAAYLDCPHILLDAPASLREITAALAFSSAFVGQSLHGCIVASAYDVPALVVAERPARRLAGFLTYRGTPELLFEGWSQAFEALGTLPSRMPVPVTMRTEVDRHWADIIAMLHQPQDRSAAQLAFLLLYARLGMRGLGPEWSLRPFRPSAYGERESALKRGPRRPERTAQGE